MDERFVPLFNKHRWFGIVLWLIGIKLNPCLLLDDERGRGMISGRLSVFFHAKLRIRLFPHFFYGD